MAGPYEKFDSAFEQFQIQLRAEMREELDIFKGELINELRSLAKDEPFDLEAFRETLYSDMSVLLHKKLQGQLDVILEQMNSLLNRVANFTPEERRNFWKVMREAITLDDPGTRSPKQRRNNPPS